MTQQPSDGSVTSTGRDTSGSTTNTGNGTGGDTGSAAPGSAGGDRTGARIRPLDPPTLPESSATFTHGTLVTGASRAVFVSGQVPWADDQGAIPADFDTQCRLVWQNLLAVLAEGGMGAENIAKVTTYLSDRRYREANGRIRAEVLGAHRPAMTIIITDIYAEEWLLEIEAIAVA